MLLRDLSYAFFAKSCALNLGNCECAWQIVIVMRNHSDYLAKNIGKAALESIGTATTHATINPETQYADLRYEPDPARRNERDRLGLLGRLAASACLLEVYSDAPGPEEFRACLSKHLAVLQERTRKTRLTSKKPDDQPSDDQLSNESVASFLWVLAAGVPTTLLKELELKPSPDWPSGIYLFGGKVLSVGIVVATKLPRERSTLLLRLMAGGPSLTPASAELDALPRDAYERTLADTILLDYFERIDQAPTRTTHEQEFLMAMVKTWEERKAESQAQGRAEGLAEGRAEGRTEGQAKALLTVLRIRGIAVPDAARERIVTQTDLEVLERWLEKAAVASSIDHVLDEP